MGNPFRSLANGYDTKEVRSRSTTGMGTPQYEVKFGDQVEEVSQNCTSSQWRDNLTTCLLWVLQKAWIVKAYYKFASGTERGTVGQSSYQS